MVRLIWVEILAVSKTISKAVHLSKQHQEYIRPPTLKSESSVALSKQHQK
jgi:hypothetical protein